MSRQIWSKKYILPRQASIVLVFFLFFRLAEPTSTASITGTKNLIFDIYGAKQSCVGTARWQNLKMTKMIEDRLVELNFFQHIWH